MYTNENVVVALASILPYEIEITSDRHISRYRAVRPNGPGEWIKGYPPSLTMQIRPESVIRIDAA